MYSPKTDNAAGRLWHALTTAQSYAGGSTHTHIAKAFGLQHSDAETVVRTLLTALEALDDVEARVKRIPKENHELYLHSMRLLRQGLVSAMANHDFNQWKGQYLRAEYLTPLMYCADLLSKFYPEEEIKPDELTKFVEELNRLYESVLQSEIEPTLKLRVVEQLHELLRAIHEYRIKGVYVLSRALASAVGTVALHKEEFIAAKDKKDADKVDGFLRQLTVLDKMISVATKAKPLLLALASGATRLAEKYLSDFSLPHHN